MAPLKQKQLAFPARKLRSAKADSGDKENSAEDCCKAVVEEVPDETVSSPRKRPILGGLQEQPQSPRLGSPSKRKNETPALLTTPTKSPRKATETPASSTTPRVSPRKLTEISKSTGTPCRQLLYQRANPRFSAAKQSLSTAVPDEVVGRETEVDAMKSFLQNAWETGGTKNRSLYISGAPGTGKTACLKNLLTKLGVKAQEIFVNCMGVTSSKDIYGKVAIALDKSYKGNQPKKFVETKICTKAGKPILLILDEIDQLDCKSQEVLYSIFEWPYLEQSRLVLVGIANALDLTDRILPRLKLSASVMPQQLSFPAYTRQQIYDIIARRLEGCGEPPIIKPMAVKFLAGKIAAISGDVRKALDVCRRAIELAEIEHKKQTVLSPTVVTTDAKQIDLPQVLSIFNQVYSSRVSDINSDLPLQQKILVASLLLMTNYGSRKCKEVTLGKLQETYGRICKKRQMASLDQGEVSSLCFLLEARGFFNVKKNKSARESKIGLRIDLKEVEAALQDKTLLMDIISDKDCIAE